MTTPIEESFWVDIPGEIGDFAAHNLGFLLEEPDPFPHVPQLGGLLLGHAGLHAVFDAGLLQPARQA